MTFQGHQARATTQSINIPKIYIKDYHMCMIIPNNFHITLIKEIPRKIYQGI